MTWSKVDGKLILLLLLLQLTVGVHQYELYRWNPDPKWTVWQVTPPPTIYQSTRTNCTSGIRKPVEYGISIRNENPLKPVQTINFCLLYFIRKCLVWKEWRNKKLDERWTDISSGIKKKDDEKMRRTTARHSGNKKNEVNEKMIRVTDRRKNEFLVLPLHPLLE